MANEKSIAHELLAQEILKSFKGKITGDNADYIVGENPENRYFVGKLLPVSDSQTSSWGSDVFIESIGADFYITPDEISSAQLTIYPRGDFYYRAYPTLEQQRTAMLQKANELFETRFTDFEELVSKYQEDPSAFSKVKEKLVPVYKKVQIHKTHFSLVFSLHELLEGKGYLKRDIEAWFGYDLDRTLDEIRPTYCFNESCQETVPEAIIAFLESTSFEDAIRNAISLGGDSDTLAAITGSIAEAAYGVPEDIKDTAMDYLDAPLREACERWTS